MALVQASFTFEMKGMPLAVLWYMWYSGFGSYDEGHVTATPKRPNRFNPMLFRLLFSQRWGYAMVCK